MKEELEEMKKLEGLSSKFWNVVMKFYDVKGEGTISEFASALNIRLSDGFFYSIVLKVLLKHEILYTTGERRKKSYLGRKAIVYRVDIGNLDKFVVKFNPLMNKVYKKRIRTAQIDLDIDVV
jgi:hypothetical protein